MFFRKSKTKDAKDQLFSTFLQYKESSEEVEKFVANVVKEFEEIFNFTTSKVPKQFSSIKKKLNFKIM